MDKRHKWLEPYTQDELFQAFLAESGSINKHLLTIFSLVVGLNTQRAVDIGAGSTTRSIRAGLEITGGELDTCDIDHEKYGHLPMGSGRYRFHATDSRSFIRSLQGPLDFVLHDGAHDRRQVGWDLAHLWPLVRQYGILCVHDTQNSELGVDMRMALRDAFRDCPVSWTHLPYCYGLTIIRIEREQQWEPLTSPFLNQRHAAAGLLNENVSCGLIDPDAVPAPIRAGQSHASVSRMRTELGWAKQRLGRLVAKFSRLIS